MVEVTARTIHGRWLLKPARALNEAIIGALARGKRRYRVRIHAVTVLSNHFHLLVSVENARQLADFMSFVNAKIAREAGRRWQWREKIWGRRYTGVVTSNEPAAQVARLRYVLGNSVKEHLVARCRDWPGVHSALALSVGQPLRGYWFDRTAESRVAGNRQPVGRYEFATPESLELDPLPCWAHLTPHEYRQRIIALITEIESEARRERKRKHIRVLGAQAISNMNPHRHSGKILSRPAPAFHAATRAVRRTMVDGYRAFVLAYREAAERLRQGAPIGAFPRGCFPPPLPFVEA